jgi:hypothetical protein
MDWNGLIRRLREIFPQYRLQSDIEQYIENRQPKSTADVELYIKQYIYHQQFMKGL